LNTPSFDPISSAIPSFVNLIVVAPTAAADDFFRNFLRLGLFITKSYKEKLMAAI
jgi:hypothetical protein